MVSERLPIVAILGRPNVGKSTLFNRYAGTRRALVEDTPGLTRDRIAEEIEVGDRRILVVDTAGLEPEATEALPAAIQAQALAAVHEADAILFVVDGKSGLVPQDEAIAEVLRRAAKPLLLAVNKIDAPAHAERALEFHGLGFERIRGVSAEHGTGAWDALEELVAGLPAAPAPARTGDEGDIVAHVALVGRPNVGKSSLLNRLAGEERVVVSEEAGTTRDAIDLHLARSEGSYVFVDTAGLRRPGRRDRVGERGGALAAIRALERAEVALVLVDASEGVTDQDVRIAGLARERGCATAVLLNKWDLVEAGEAGARRIREQAQRRLRFMADAPIVGVSARTGLRVGRVFDLVRGLATASRRRIPTAELNRWLREATAAHEPAMAQRGTRRRPLKFFYATQTSIQPPSFVLFCTEPRAVQESYRRYLEKQLRKRFGLEGVALRLHLRARHPA